MKTEASELIHFHLTGERPEGARNDPAALGLCPALLSGYRDLTTIRHDYPLVLIAGERRAYNANTIYRDPRWRRKDLDGALRIHPEDAEICGVEDGGRARCESARGRIDVRIEVCDKQQPGVVSLPHGYGLGYPDGVGGREVHGPVINLLTDAAHCDPISATPFHKYVSVRLEALG